MEERQLIFDQFIDQFVKLDTRTKEKEIVEKQKKIISFLLEYASSKEINFYMLQSREINDILEKNPTHDDFLEAIMVYTQNIEELMGQIINR